MTIANVDDFGRNVRSAIRHHWVLFLIPGIVMAILGLLAAVAPSSPRWWWKRLQGGCS
jgi:uncharacterized membrane protein HdeD (DUF308 family)